jgi:hypothetical protein
LANAFWKDGWEIISLFCKKWTAEKRNL